MCSPEHRGEEEVEEEEEEEEEVEEEEEEEEEEQHQILSAVQETRLGFRACRSQLRPANSAVALI